MLSAQKALAALRQQQTHGGTLHFMPGTHWEAHLELTSTDSGLTIEGSSEGTSRLVGGKRIQNWNEDESGWLVADLPDAASGKLDFRMLCIHGEFAPRARYPEVGALIHDTHFACNWLSSSEGGWDRKPTHEEMTTMTYKKGDLGAWLDPRNAEVQLFHQWDDSLVGLKGVDHEHGRLIFNCMSSHPPGAFYQQGKNPKAMTYVLWNIREGMTHPGQWYLNRSAGKLYYWPKPGERPENLQAMVPTATCILRAHGRSEQALEQITIRDLELTVNSTPLTPSEFGACHLPGAIEILDHARHIHLHHLHIHHVGGAGIRFTGTGEKQKTPENSGFHQVQIHDCTIEQTGGPGITMRGHLCTISNCRIENIGIHHFASIALHTGGSQNAILHNTVKNCPYSAIVAGGSYHRVEYNYIENFMTRLDDGGAIYSYSFKHGLYRGNVAIGHHGTTSHAYYLDELSENSVVEQNLAIDTHWPFQGHMAKNCTVRDNIFIDEGETLISLARCRDFAIERNLILSKDRVIFRMPKVGLASLNGNLIHCEHESGVQVMWNPELGYDLTEAQPYPMNSSNCSYSPELFQKHPHHFALAQASPGQTLHLLEQDFSNAGVLELRPSESHDIAT